MFISKRNMKYILITIAAAMAASVVLMFAVKRPATAETPPHQNHDSGLAAWNDNTALPTSGSYYLTGDVNLSTTAELDGDLTLCLNGFTISGSVTKFKVTSGHTLNICDCSDGESGKLTGTTDDSAVIVDGGTFNLYSGSISDNKITADNKNGGGVAVQNNGIFNMYGGSISENKSKSTATNFGYGGGVFVDQSKFTMSGGEISDNTASKDGGGVYLKSAEFIMSGGTISYNTSLAATANIDHIVGGGGVYVGGGSTFEMSGGSTIEHNTAATSGGGVNVDTTAKFTMESGTISETNAQYGGGVYSKSYMNNTNPTKTTMYGGIISNNTAAENGGGVNVGGGYVNGQDTFFTLSGGAISDNTASGDGGGIWLSVSNSATTMENGNVSGNTAKNGGGIWIGRNTMKITDSTISGNTATVNGGGVCADNGYLTIDGTIISDNDANQNGGGLYISYMVGPNNAIGGDSKISGNTAANGGGLYLNNGILQITNGKVSGNTATGNGGGVYYSDGMFVINGAANITDNHKTTKTKSDTDTANNVYLPNGKTITIGGFNAANSEIGVTVENPAVNCQAYVPVTSSCSSGTENGFTSDDEDCDVMYANGVVNLTGPHDWEDGEITPPTCTEDGEKPVICTICTKATTKAIPATGHDWGKWETDDDNHWKTCQNGCGTQSEEDGEHTWDNDEGVVTTPATTTSTGVRTYTCTVCQHQKTENIPKLENSDPDNSTTSSSTPSGGGGGTRPSDSTPSESEPSDSTPTESSETPPESGDPTPSESASSTDESSSEPSEIAPPISDNPATGIAVSVLPVASLLTILAIAAKRNHTKK